MSSRDENEGRERTRKRDYTQHFDWSNDLNLDVYKCYLKAREDPSLGYMTRLKMYWDYLHPELTIFNAKQLRQQATFVEQKEDFKTGKKYQDARLDAIGLDGKPVVDVKRSSTNSEKYNNDSSSTPPVSNTTRPKRNLNGRKQEPVQEITITDSNVEEKPKELPKNNKKSTSTHYYEMVMTSGTPVTHLYREAMEQVHTYNSKLLLERRLRMPYIDNQTGLAQQDCHLWVSRVQRCTPMKQGQIYSYPARRWMVRKRPDFIGSSKDKKTPTDGEENSQDGAPEADKTTAEKSEESAAPAPPHVPVTTYEDYYDDDPFDSEMDSDEEFGSRKKKRKGGKNFKGKKSSMALKLGDKSRNGSNGMDKSDKNQSFDCQMCNKKYKNQQSLRYHYEHHNHNNAPGAAGGGAATGGGDARTPVNGTEPEPAEPANDGPPPDHVTGAKRKKGMPPSSYCDFCLGSADINKKSGSSEELVSCADCGRSGHPSCLQFNENLTGQVKKYKWQCIECKCCCLCGTSDNDEQLLFCDDCDRGYHMYCLNPPIDEPPEGSWQCQLCEARVKGEDITKVPVLPQHMDIGVALSTSAPSSSNTVTSDTASPMNQPGNDQPPVLTPHESSGQHPAVNGKPHPNTHASAFSAANLSNGYSNMHHGMNGGGSAPGGYPGQQPPPHLMQHPMQFGNRGAPPYGLPRGGNGHPMGGPHPSQYPMQYPPQHGMSPRGGAGGPPHMSRHPQHGAPPYGGPPRGGPHRPIPHTAGQMGGSPYPPQYPHHPQYGRPPHGGPPQYTRHQQPPGQQRMPNLTPSPSAAQHSPHHDSSSSPYPPPPPLKPSQQPPLSQQQPLSEPMAQDSPQNHSQDDQNTNASLSASHTSEPSDPKETQYTATVTKPSSTTPMETSKADDVTNTPPLPVKTDHNVESFLSSGPPQQSEELKTA